MTLTNRDCSPRVLDLFAGAGGLSSGFAAAGFDVVAGIDNWRDAMETFAYNHPSAVSRQANLSNGTAVDAVQGLPFVDVVVGGPPCQGFSIAGKRDPGDPRNRLYEGFLSIVKAIRPQAFVMENVPNLASMSEGEVFSEILADFESLGYSLAWKILTASEFGIPQKRRRLFLIGTRGRRYEFPAPSPSRVSSAEAISDLPSETLVDGRDYPVAPKSDYQAMMRLGSTGVWNHQVTNHTETTRRIISMVPDGGNYKNLPEHLRGTRKVNIAWTRLASGQPSFTIDTGHRHHFHYSYNRVPTVRESARLQSFHDAFIFVGSKASQYKQVGNAVPPLLAERVATQLASYLEH